MPVIPFDLEELEEHLPTAAEFVVRIDDIQHAVRERVSERHYANVLIVEDNGNGARDGNVPDIIPGDRGQRMRTVSRNRTVSMSTR